MSAIGPLEFGDRAVGQHYHLRPGSYAVIRNGENQVAVVRTLQGYFLPGGGAEPGETPEATLRREIREECGYEIAMIEPLGFAIQYVFAEGEGYFAKQCSFFQAKLAGHVARQTEDDHQLIWLPISAAAETLTHASQSWAVSLVG
ncbi:MAG TPA: NUDIX domain-containing protein [Pirellulales bacterium]|jgi:8-oxo-dGTP diphosphatase|nr:NUDIX domain-containing protein [Pirellulales bacterium]